MLNREIRDKKDELLKATIKLRALSFDKNLSFDKSSEIRKEQEEKYKLWQFYNNLTKTQDKIKKNVN